MSDFSWVLFLKWNVFLIFFCLGRSPVFSHMNATLQGSATVRAFNAETMLENEFHVFQDHNTSCWYLFTCASRWYAFWLDMVCLIFIAVIVYSFLIFGNGIYNFSSGLAQTMKIYYKIIYFHNIDSHSYHTFSAHIVCSTHTIEHIWWIYNILWKYVIIYFHRCHKHCFLQMLTFA